MKTGNTINRLTTVLLTVVLLLAISGSQEQPASEENKPDETKNITLSYIKEITENPLAIPDTTSPQATLKSFLHNINSAYRRLSENSKIEF